MLHVNAAAALISVISGCRLLTANGNVSNARWHEGDLYATADGWIVKFDESLDNWRIISGNRDDKRVDAFAVFDERLFFVIYKDTHCVTAWSRFNRAIYAGRYATAGFLDGDLLKGMMNNPRDIEVFNGLLIVADTYNGAVRVLDSKRMRTVIKTDISPMFIAVYGLLAVADKTLAHSYEYNNFTVVQTLEPNSPINGIKCLNYTCALLTETYLMWINPLIPARSTNGGGRELALKDENTVAVLTDDYRVKECVIEEASALEEPEY